MELGQIIGENIQNLRKEKGMTQKDLADLFSYTPKAVSKWERGETIPEITTLKIIAEYFGVTVDCLLQEKGYTQKIKYADKTFKRNIFIIQSCLIVSLIWTAVGILFVYLLQKGDVSRPWMAFIWGIPLSCIPPIIVYSKYNSDKKVLITTIFSSLFIWGTLTALYIQFIKANFYLIFLIGIPAQLSILFGYYVYQLKNSSLK